MFLPKLVNRSQFIVYWFRRTVNCQPSTVNRKTKGFTLIELLVVISIIAILVAAATASWTNAQKKSRDGKRKSDLKSVQQALELYFQNNGRYPNSSNGNIFCDSAHKGWGQKFDCDGTSYMNPLPRDPVSQNEYVYSYQSFSDPNPLSYILSAELENEKDPDNADSPGYVNGTLPCDPNPKNYCVVNP